MNISRESFEIILDLIEIKMSTLQIHDKDDEREVNKLRKCRQELLSLLTQLNLKSIESDTKAPPLPKKDHKAVQSRH